MWLPDIAVEPESEHHKKIAWQNVILLHGDLQDLVNSGVCITSAQYGIHVESVLGQEALASRVGQPPCQCHLTHRSPHISVRLVLASLRVSPILKSESRRRRVVTRAQMMCHGRLH